MIDPSAPWTSKLAGLVRSVVDRSNFIPETLLACKWIIRLWGDMTHWVRSCFLSASLVRDTTRRTQYHTRTKGAMLWEMTKIHFKTRSCLFRPFMFLWQKLIRYFCLAPSASFGVSLFRYCWNNVTEFFSSLLHLNDEKNGLDRWVQSIKIQIIPTSRVGSSHPLPLCRLRRTPPPFRDHFVVKSNALRSRRSFVTLELSDESGFIPLEYNVVPTYIGFSAVTRTLRTVLNCKSHLWPELSVFNFKHIFTDKAIGKFL